MMFNIGRVGQAIASRYLQGTSDLETVAPILLAIHLYYFMKTGSLLTAFNEVKALRDELLKDYLKGQPEGGKVGPLHGTTSFLAAAFYDDEPGPVHAARGPWWQWMLGRWVPYFVITALVVSIAQAAALFLVYEAYHASAMFWLVIVIVLVLLITLYIMFWKAGPSQATTARRSIRQLVREIRDWIVSAILEICDGAAEGAGPPGKAQREQTRRTWTVVVLLGSVILWLFLFTRLHRDRRGAPYFFSGNQLSRGAPFISRDAL
jgi:cbb3-type cytochrome oxidase subunit 3